MTTPSPTLTLIAFESRPCTPPLPFEPDCPGLTGTATFEVTFEETDGSITRDLRTAWHFDPTDSLTVNGIGGDAMTWFGGGLSLTGRVYAAILDALGVTDWGTTPTT